MPSSRPPGRGTVGTAAGSLLHVEMLLLGHNLAVKMAQIGVKPDSNGLKLTNLLELRMVFSEDEIWFLWFFGKKDHI